MTEKIYTIPVVSGVFIVNFEQILCRLILIDDFEQVNAGLCWRYIKNMF